MTSASCAVPGDSMTVELRCRNCGSKHTAKLSGEPPRYCPLCAIRFEVLRSRFLLSDLKHEARERQDARQGITAATFDMSAKLREMLSEVRQEPLDLTERTVIPDLTAWIVPRPWPLCANCATSRLSEESHG
jgi:hypothetical protein